MAVITISRQFGSGGDEIANRVCETLGYRFFDKRLMTQVAAEVGLSDSEILDFSEDHYQTRSFLERLTAWRGSRTLGEARTWSDAGGGVLAREVTKLDEAAGVSFVRGTILAVYERGNVVIVGRGGQAVLKDKPGVLHVRIVAPYQARVQRLLERENFNPGGAKDTVLKHDRASAEYLKRFYDVDWEDPMLYDLILNTNKYDVKSAAHIIVNAVGHLPTEKKE
ncbi:MAG: Cytidylate kinase [Anaerolineae bacterium]|nr:Cytidylate kinase [Anaerolineae bacterium]